MTRPSPISPKILLHGYARGIFPMAEGRDASELHWFDPKRRGVLPLDGLHISRTLRKRLLRQDYSITIDREFKGVVRACAAREETWINDEIFDLYCQLYDLGFAHSLEVWEGDSLAGGVYGVTLGAAFFGESMFSNRRDGSKIALAHMTARLSQTGYTLFDTQFITPHLKTMGGIEISRAAYHAQLKSALNLRADICEDVPMPTIHGVVQRSTQTS